MRKLTIDTEWLHIRNLKTTDLPDFHFYRSNPEVTKYQGFDDYTIDEASEFIQVQLGKEFGKPGNGFNMELKIKRQEK